MATESVERADRPSRGPRLAAASVVGLFVPFLIPLGVLLVAASDRRAMKEGRRRPEPPFLYRFAMVFSVIALVGQFATLALATSVWSSAIEQEQASGAVGVVGNPCVAADRCCAAIHGAGAPECERLGALAGELQYQRNEASGRAINRAVCTQHLRAMREELATAEQEIPAACGFTPLGQPTAAK